MKFRAEIEVPEGADWQTIEDAKATATWNRIYSKQERMAKTDLTDKCGSCKYFCPFVTHYMNGTKSLCHGNCSKGKTYRSRTNPCCKDYERTDK